VAALIFDGIEEVSGHANEGTSEENAGGP